MRTMVFGDAACGKSTFAKELGQLTETPVVHLDSLMQEVGRQNKELILPKIIEAADGDSWIIEGNAFTKDPIYRIERADRIIAFDFHPLRALASHIKRSYLVRRGIELPAGGSSGELNLAYFLPYILKDFPERKKQAINAANEIGKPITLIKSRQQARQYLSKIKQ